MNNVQGNKVLIDIRDLSKIYRQGDVDVHALRGANLQVEKGEFLAICGASGSGKSTLFHVLGALTPATSGSVVIDGRDIAQMTPSERTRFRRHTVGFVFQRYNLLPTLTAQDNIRLAHYIAGLSGKKGDKTATKKSNSLPEGFGKILETLGITSRLSHKPRALSGGQQQRVAIARALVNRPAILLADEPTGNLDSQNAAAVLDLLKELNEREGQTILMITHDTDAASYATRVVHMRDGRIL
ncbi:MAG: ABC transporter ATP-binding protein [Terracidiphilus sp.]|nr:ABC transporter ATP-binding protein [Terracidiphilus sp.]